MAQDQDDDIHVDHWRRQLAERRRRRETLDRIQAAKRFDWHKAARFSVYVWAGAIAYACCNFALHC